MPLGVNGDSRAWDAVISRGNVAVGVEAETRLVDIQALERCISLKARDGEMTRVAPLLADTRTNRTSVRSFAPQLAGSFPVRGSVAFSDLDAGRIPAGNSVLIL